VLLVRGGLAAVAVTVVGAVIATQYVGTHVFGEVVPALVGVAASLAVGAATGRSGRWPAVAGVVSALLSTALAWRFVPGSRLADVVTPVATVLPSYVAAVVGALVATPAGEAVSSPSARPVGRSPGR
jgi:hypothetical protein